jgi:hypothetical protein
MFSIINRMYIIIYVLFIILRDMELGIDNEFLPSICSMFKPNAMSSI